MLRPLFMTLDSSEPTGMNNNKKLLLFIIFIRSTGNNRFVQPASVQTSHKPGFTGPLCWGCHCNVMSTLLWEIIGKMFLLNETYLITSFSYWRLLVISPVTWRFPSYFQQHWIFYHQPVNDIAKFPFMGNVTSQCVLPLRTREEIRDLGFGKAERSLIFFLLKIRFFSHDTHI